MVQSASMIHIRGALNQVGAWSKTEGHGCRAPARQGSPERVPCPSCDSANTCTLGTIPPSIHFAGQKLLKPIPGGQLHRCESCQLCFRFPRLAKGELEALYAQAPADNWQYSPSSRRDWQIASSWILRSNVRPKVLDVGCYDGGFLTFLGEAVEPYGIEFNLEASSRAQAKNIGILGNDFDNLERLSSTFDVVVAMDVMEHCENPARLLRSMAAVVRSGGLLVVSTGNTDSWSWRIMGSRYWYCTVSEHISFTSPKWARRVAPSAGLDVVTIETYSHRGEATHGRRLSDLLKNLAYHCFPDTVAWLRTVGYGGVDAKTHESMAQTPPGWLSAADHYIAVFRKH